MDELSYYDVVKKYNIVVRSLGIKKVLGVSTDSDEFPWFLITDVSTGKTENISYTEVCEKFNLLVTTWGGRLLGVNKPGSFKEPDFYLV